LISVFFLIMAMITISVSIFVFFVVIFFSVTMKIFF
jgi:hypothetical protein